MCKQCKLGTTTKPGGKCMPCKNSTFGYKCLSDCVCNHSQRCDPKVGCIQKTNISIIHTTYTDTTHTAYNNISAGPSEQSLLRNEKVTSNKTIIRNGTAISEWIILTLCIIGGFIMAGFGYLICTFRKRLSFNSRITGEDVILEPSPNIGVYDEIDENPLTFDTTDINVSSQESHYETIDVVSQESLSIATSSEHSDTGYLDPYFAIEEDASHLLQDQTSQEECISFNSSNENGVDQDNRAYNNLYQPLHENWQLDSHGYEVPVMVHKCFKISANEYVTNNSSYNVTNRLQKDRDMNNHTYENQKSPETKVGNNETLVGDDSSSVFKTGNLHDYININAESNISMINCHTLESFKLTDRDNLDTTEQKSFRGEIDLEDESMKSGSNKIYLNKTYWDENDSNSNGYEDAKSCA